MISFARMSAHTWTNMVFSPITIIGSVIKILASHSSCSPPMTWPEWIARSRSMWQCLISTRHSTLPPTCAFSEIWSSLVYTGTSSPGYAPFWQPGQNRWWSRAVTPKHILWPLGLHGGPYFSSSFINDLPNVIDPQTAVRLFADDCLLYRSIRSMSDKVQLQRDQSSLSKWGECWGMHFSMNKSHIMHIANKTGPRLYELNSVALSEVKYAKYLDVLLSYDQSWSLHISSIVTQAHRRLGFLQHNLWGSPFRYRGTAYQAPVRSQLEYCCTLWDPTLKGKIEWVQWQTARWARGEYGMISVTRLLKPVGLPSPATPTSRNGHVSVASHPPCARALSSALFLSGITYPLPQPRPIHS